MIHITNKTFFLKGLTAMYDGRAGDKKIDLHGDPNKPIIILPHAEKVYYGCNFNEIVKMAYKKDDLTPLNEVISDGRRKIYNDNNKQVYNRVVGALINEEAGDDLLILNNGNTIHFLDLNNGGTWRGDVDKLIEYIEEHCKPAEFEIKYD